MDGAASPTRPGCSAGWREITRPARATCHPFRYKTLPTRAGRRHYRYKTRPARTTCHPFRYKTRPARPKWPNLARFALAGRVFSRFCRQQAPHATSPGTKLTLHEPRGGISGTKLAPRKLGARRSGTKLAQHAQNGLIWRVFLSLGEFCPAFVANKPSRANFLPHQPHPITGTKETTPQHNTPSRAVKHLPPQHHTQTRAVKHLPPQHATNNPKSPIFTTQGRTFFQPSASRPSQPTVACNSNSAEPHTNMETAEFQRADFKP